MESIEAEWNREKVELREEYAIDEEHRAALTAAQQEIERLREIVRRCRTSHLNLIEFGIIPRAYIEEAKNIAEECWQALSTAPAQPAPPQSRAVAVLDQLDAHNAERFEWTGEPAERDFEAEARAKLAKKMLEGNEYVLLNSRDRIGFSKVTPGHGERCHRIERSVGYVSEEAVNWLADKRRRGHTYDD